MSERAEQPSGGGFEEASKEEKTIRASIDDVNERLKNLAALRAQKLEKDVSEREQLIQDEKRWALLSKDAAKDLAFWEDKRKKDSHLSKEELSSIEELETLRNQAEAGLSDVRSRVDFLSAQPEVLDTLHNAADSEKTRRDDEAKAEKERKLKFEEAVKKIQLIGELKQRGEFLHKKYEARDSGSAYFLMEDAHNALIDLNNDYDRAKRNKGFFAFRDRRIASETLRELPLAEKKYNDAFARYNKLYDDRIDITRKAEVIRLDLSNSTQNEFWTRKGKSPEYIELERLYRETVGQEMRYRITDFQDPKTNAKIRQESGQS